MFVVAKGYYGLGGNLAVWACAAKLARSINAELIADWRDGFYGSSGDDVYAYLIKAPKSNALPRDVWGELEVWPPEWKPYITETKPHIKGLELSRVTATAAAKALGDCRSLPDIVVISRDDEHWHSPLHEPEMSEILKGIRPSDEIQYVVDDFRSAYFAPTTIGVHFRHGNGERTVVPPDFEWFCAQIDRYLAAERRSKVFVCTDCRAALDRFISRYGDRVIHSPKHYPANGSGGMHYGQDASSRLRSAKEAFVDILLLSECNYLVGSKSFFTAVAMKRAGHFTSGSRSLWLPKNRAYSPPQGHTSLSLHVSYSTFIRSRNLSLDGLHVCPKDEFTNEIFYLYESLGTYGQELSLNDFDEFKEKLLKLRLY